MEGSAIIVYFHGSGFIVGSPATHVDVTASLSETTSLELWSLDYGLSPEYTTTEQIAQGLAACGTARRPLILAGDSAGAAIALAVAQAAGTAGLTVLAGVSFYGFFGLFDTDCLSDQGLRRDGMDRACLDRYWRLANPGRLVPPVHAQRIGRGMDCPILLVGGLNDPVYGNSKRLREMLHRVVCDVHLHTVPGADHGFLKLQCHLHQITMQQASAWLLKTVASQDK